MVYRIYVEKKKGLANEAKSLLGDIKAFLGIEGIEDVRVVNLSLIHILPDIRLWNL